MKHLMIATLLLISMEGFGQSAGPDQTICLNSSATMAATGNGAWTALPINPTATTIDSPSSPTTVITGFTVPGTWYYIWDMSGVFDTVSVTVVSAQSACFTESDTMGCSGGYITFCPCTSTALVYEWSISPVTGVVPAVQIIGSDVCFQANFSLPGNYCATLITSYSGGCRDSVTKCNINLDAPVTPLSFIATDTASCMVPASFSVAYTGDTCSTCLFTWNPPINTTPSSHTGTDYTLLNFGTLWPELTVTTPNGCTTSIIKPNYLQAEPLQACNSISFIHGNGCVNDTIVITNCTAGGPFANVTWNFPGATVVYTSFATAMVTYASTGCHDYTMILQSTTGCIDTLFDSICIGSLPNVNLGLSPHDLCYGSGCNLFTVNIAAGDTPTSVNIWPEGLYTAANQSFTLTADSLSSCYTYPNQGDFAVCYVASMMGCRSDTMCLTAPADSVHIHPPLARFTEIIPCTNVTSLSFVNQCSGADSVVWKFNGNFYPNPSNDTIAFPFPVCGTANTVSITAYNLLYGCVATFEDSTASAPCYGADFIFGSTVGCYNDYHDIAEVFLTSPGNYAPLYTSTLWSAQLAPSGPVFGTYSGDTPTIVLYNYGQYNACARLSYANGCVDTICKDLYIDISKSAALFAVDDSAGCTPVCVNFTNLSTDTFGSLNTYSWNFGDGSPINNTTPNPSHCYTMVGQFQACLTVTDTNGCSSTYCKQIQSNIVTASFTESDSVTCTNNPSPLNPITFTSTSTGFISSFDWLLPPSLGDSPSVAPNSPSITERFNNQGYDSMGLVVIDQVGICRDTAWLPIRVVNPIANYTFPLNDTFSTCPPVFINPFVDSSTGAVSYSWNFGDGTTDTAQNPSHLYTLPGYYPVTETVTSLYGCVDSITKDTIQLKGPSISLTTQTLETCPCTSVVFTAVLTSIYDSVQITFGGTVGAYANPPFWYFSFNGWTYVDTITVTFCDPGIYRPSAFVMDLSTNCGVMYDSLIAPIVVDTPIAGFSYIPLGCGSDSVQFNNLTSYATSYGHSLGQVWHFGDGSTDTSSNPVHHYASTGSYSVTLVVTGIGGCTSSMTEAVTVDSCTCNIAGHISRGPVIFGQENDTIVITSPERNDTSPLGYYLYHWTCVNWPGNLYDVQGADSIYFIHSYTDYFINNGIYSVTVYDTALGCSQTFLDTVSALSCDLHDSVSYTYLDSGRYQFVAHTNTGSPNVLYNWAISGQDPFYAQSQGQYSTSYIGSYFDIGGNTFFDAGNDTVRVRLSSGIQSVILQVYDTITGCRNIDSFTFNVPNYSYIAIDTGTSICENGNVLLNTFVSEGQGTCTALPSNPGHTRIQYNTYYYPGANTVYIDSFIQAGTYGFIWSGAGLADTVYITVNAPPTISVSPSSVSICRGLSTILTAIGSPPGGAYDWWTINDTTASSVSVSPASSKDYIVDYAAGGCGVTDTIRVTVTNCADTVWPGDADANYVVDNNDLLPIGLGYDSTGPIRAVQGIVWQHDSATYWANSFTSYFPVVNFCHADCNGDGIINADDTLAIVTNFGRTHLSAHIAQAWRAGLPPIYPKVSPDTAFTGDTLSIFVNLGDSLMPATNVYGVAFTVHYDALVVDTNTVSVAFGNSWFGGSSNSISISKTFAGQGMVKAALTRIDHTNISGQGLIATVRAIVTTDNIDGKQEYYQFRCSISDVRLIDDQGNIISVNEGADSNQVGFTPLSIADIADLNSAIQLYPNPAKSYITVSCSKTKVNGIELVNLLGETVSQASYTDTRREHTIDVKGLSSGIYYALIKTESGTVTRKVTITE